MKECLHPLLTVLSPAFCSQELLVADIQFHNAEDMEYRAPVGKRPVASEPVWQQSCRMQVSLWDSHKASQELDQHQGLPKVHSSVCGALPVLGKAEGTERH